MQFLGYSPLLASIDIKLDAKYANTDSLANINSNLINSPHVHEVFYQKNLIDKINSNVNRLSAFLLFLCGLLFIISKQITYCVCDLAFSY